MVIGLAAALLIFSCGVALVGSGALENLMQAGGYRGDLAAMCENVGDTVNRANRPSAARPYRVGIINHRGNWHSYNDRLPEIYRAADLESTDAVVCVSGNREYLLETCEYYDQFDYSSDPDVMFRIRRIMYYNDVFLLNPETGKTFAVLRVWGTHPEACDDYEQGSKGATHRRYGEPPGFNAFYDELVSEIH